MTGYRTHSLIAGCSVVLLLAQYVAADETNGPTVGDAIVSNGTVAVEAPDTTAVEAPDTTAVEVPDTTAVEVPDSNGVEVPDTTAVEVPDSNAVLPEVEEAALDLWFEVGERLEYRLYWGVVHVGEAEIDSEWVEEDGQRLIRIRLRARTGDVVSRIYPVNDTITTFVDPSTFLPVVYRERLREGNRRRNETVTFHHDEGFVHWVSREKNIITNIPIEADTRDVLCLMYYLRQANFEPEQVDSFTVLVDRKLYGLETTGLEVEEVRLNQFGWVEALKIEPRASFGEIFERRGTVNMWFSNDDRQICVRADAEVPLASVQAILRSVEGPGDDFWTSGRRRRRGE